MWARLDDAILDNPKIIEAGALGFALHVAAITWCARNLSDGFIPKRRVGQLLDLTSLHVSEATEAQVRHAVTAADVAADLARIGLWHDRGRMWELHDYLDYNPPRERVLARREAARKRRANVQRTSRERRANVPRSSLHPVPVPVPEEDLLSFASLTQGAAAPRVTELGFDRFWAAYPKKRHKPAAVRAWKGADGARHLEAILGGVERWKASDAWSRGFVEDPATFLRQRQWEDTAAEEEAAAVAARGDAIRAEARRKLEEGTL